MSLNKYQEKDNMKLGFGLVFKDLYKVDGINKINDLFNSFIMSRGNCLSYDDIVIMAKNVEDFLIELFSLDSDEKFLQIMNENKSISDRYKSLRKQEVLRKIKAKSKGEEIAKRYKNKNNYTELFDLTDAGIDNEKTIANSHYCIVCHPRGKDSCASVETGCPLRMKISQMIDANKSGNILGALVLATIDNPLLALTGHRICNDCRLGCIYKADKVDIPSIETSILDTVLQIDYGFEIYSLLTRWNPLRKDFSMLKKARSDSEKVLVVGAGPSGIAASYYMLMEGLSVTNIESLKVEPLHVPFQPIRNVFDELFEELSSRRVGGFGGVAEYGITVRWNKNYLKLIRLILERFDNYNLVGSTFFDKSIKDNILESGYFSKVISCVGSGKSRVLRDVENNLCPGVRQASDFLMTLNLEAPFKDNSIANLEIRRPIVVIGGGLTAVDAATEAKAYYIAQVKKFKNKYDNNLVDFDKLSEKDKKIANEFIHDADLSIEALSKNIKSTIIYRGEEKGSPAYRLNKEELLKAYEEGVNFRENLSPLRFVMDNNGYLSGVECINNKTGKVEIIEAKSALIAAGIEEHRSLLESSCNDKSKDIIEFPEMGNVVKSIANVKDNIRHQVIDSIKPIKSDSFDIMSDDLFSSRVSNVNVLSSNITEIIIHSPIRAKCFKPGQFFKLQNYADNPNNLPIIEPLALTGFWVDKEKGLISLIVLECGESSKLCRLFAEGEKISLMGPTGTPTIIPENKEKFNDNRDVAPEKVLLIGGGLGNAVLPSIGREIIKASSKNEVHYIAGYKRQEDIFYADYIEKSANKTTFVVGEKTVLDALFDYKDNELKSFDRIIIVGSVAMMSAVSKAIKENKDKFKNTLKVIASINSPMQCMMKGVCGQCIQKHENGDYIFSCENQDQDALSVDFEFLNNRLSCNSLLEKINNL